MIAFRIAATSFFSTNHESAADMLASRERVLTPPAYKLLVARARRFTSLATQMHIEVLGNLPIEPNTTAVFATVHGEIQTADQLLADFRDNGVVSSARFALSVHNSPSGVYSVATQNTAPTTTITGDNAIAAGWLEAALTLGEVGRSDSPAVLLSIADEPVPEVFHGPGETVGFGAGFLLSSSTGRAAELAVVAGDDQPVDPRHVLATLSLNEPTTLLLGRIGPGQQLQLRLL